MDKFNTGSTRRNATTAPGESANRSYSVAKSDRHSGSSSSADRNSRNGEPPAEGQGAKPRQPGANNSRLYLRVSEPRTCETCGAEFLPLKVNRGQRFCQWSCYAAWRSSQDTKGEKNPNWKGGVAKDHYRYKKRFADKSPEKVRAHQTVYHAKKAGTLVPQPCESCGAEEAHAHHEQYDRPLEVRWLCQPCHNRLHADGERIPSPPPPSDEPFVWRGKLRHPRGSVQR